MFIRKTQKTYGDTHSLPSLEINHHGPKAKKRKDCKQAVHATNYGGSARAIANVLGWTVREAEAFQRRWFSIHPGIKTNFHGRIESIFTQHGWSLIASVYRRVYFDRIESVFTEASRLGPAVDDCGSKLPRRTPALERECPFVEMLLQVHDSLVFQVPIKWAEQLNGDPRRTRISHPIYPAINDRDGAWRVLPSVGGIVP